MVIKRTKDFADSLQRKIGARTIPLRYVIHTNDTIIVTPLPLARGQPYSTTHRLVEEEFVARVSHAHALYRDNNSSVCYLLEEVTRDTNFSALI